MTDQKIRLGKSKRDLYLLLDSGKRRVRYDAQCRVAKEAFLKCGHLVAFRPTIVVQPSVPPFNKHSHTKLDVLDRGERYQANIVRMSVKRIHGQDNSGARLIEVHKINFAASGVPGMRSAGHLIPGECPQGRFLKSSCFLPRSVAGIGEKGCCLFLKFFQPLLQNCALEQLIDAVAGRAHPARVRHVFVDLLLYREAL